VADVRLKPCPECGGTYPAGMRAAHVLTAQHTNPLGLSELGPARQFIRDGEAQLAERRREAPEDAGSSPAPVTTTDFPAIMGEAVRREEARKWMAAATARATASLGTWHRGPRSTREGDPPHTTAWFAGEALQRPVHAVYGSADREDIVAFEDDDGCRAEVVRIEPYKPKRIQMRRGEKLPPLTVYVGRPTRWGNPFKIGDNHCPICRHGMDRPEVVRLYAEWLEIELIADRDFLEPLRGKDLACWCPLVDDRGNEVLCHASVLLERANRG
jgi:hypothetical protein